MCSGRRQFIKTAVGYAAAAPLWSRAIASGIAASPEQKSERIEATRLTDTISLFTGAGANVLAARAPEGLVLVDGGSREKSRALLRTLYKEMDARKVHALFNTHWHPSHTGSNERLGRDGAKIIAHANTKLWLSTDITLPWLNTTYEPLPPVAHPNETIYDRGTLQVADEEVRYGYLLQAHTDGDIYVFFPKSNVLAIGGLISGNAWPIIDYVTGGWIGGLVQGLTTLAGIANDETRIVPGNGSVITKKDVEAQRAMFATIFDRLSKSMRKGLGPEEALALEPTKEFDAQFGDPRQFVLMAFRSMWGHLSPDA
jgi:glyoxylase-like metal-dependent hydrolase (beta-lactamase superfamily II)